MFLLKSIQFYSNLFAIAVISQNYVRCKREVLLVKYAKPNQTTYYVRYNHVFVKTVIIITEFYSIHNLLLVRIH
jgi:hypothetical protein